jgi:hypothetical protein
MQCNGQLLPPSLCVFRFQELKPCRVCVCWRRASLVQGRRRGKGSRCCSPGHWDLVLSITITTSVHIVGSYPATMEITHWFLNMIPTDFQLVPVSPMANFCGFGVFFSNIRPILIWLPISSIHRVLWVTHPSRSLHLQTKAQIFATETNRCTTLVKKQPCEIHVLLALEKQQSCEIYVRYMVSAVRSVT